MVDRLQRGPCLRSVASLCHSTINENIFHGQTVFTAITGIHPHRTAGGHRHHSNLGRNAPAIPGEGQIQGHRYFLHEQYQAVDARVEVVYRRQRRPVSRGRQLDSSWGGTRCAQLDRRQLVGQHQGPGAGSQQLGPRGFYQEECPVAVLRRFYRHLALSGRHDDGLQHARQEIRSPVSP